MNYSIDKILNIVPSKYQIVYIASQRANQMDETKHYQMKENEYKSRKNLDRALEEIQNNLIHIKEK
ncbi:MAG: DNA-directed RNA polymerase subunit omega [Bacilli bacterium]|nr:DNA-directed RNA polymerase subunit omega [Bacilli bacterium]